MMKLNYLTEYSFFLSRLSEIHQNRSQYDGIKKILAKFFLILTYCWTNESTTQFTLKSSEKNTFQSETLASRYQIYKQNSTTGYEIYNSNLYAECRDFFRFIQPVVLWWHGDLFTIFVAIWNKFFFKLNTLCLTCKQIIIQPTDHHLNCEKSLLSSLRFLKTKSDLHLMYFCSIIIITFFLYKRSLMG